ncbi:MAG: class II aldolase/adducin family protein [Candidatus Bipolaricaulaceae bacterium]
MARAAKWMAAQGLVTGSSGNVSVRVGETVLITPSGIPYQGLDPRQVVEMDGEGRRRSGSGVPSSEWRMHVAIYRGRGEVRAIVHTHAPYATAVALAGALPVVHDEGKILFGESIPCSRPAPPGTWGLADGVAAALGSTGKAALIGRHGAVTVGATLGEALGLAVKVEEAARLSLIGRRPGA